ncbi:MAG: hypothetical protein K9L24_02220, partial [Spirochaetia bacterium]|nr:hypothetical protein [Spirochaetia bacterium]
FIKRDIEFDKFREIWLEPIFRAFPNLAIHEAVYEELVDVYPKTFVDEKYKSDPPGIIIHRDSSLTKVEKILKDTIEARIAYHTNYEPLLDNKNDRGEVKSLSYIAVKGLLFFAAHDNNAIQLIEKSEEWSTGLDNVQAIRMYELIYYLYKKSLANTKALRILYKHQYFLTKHEKHTNPNWGNFTSSMKKNYETYFSLK